MIPKPRGGMLVRPSTKAGIRQDHCALVHRLKNIRQWAARATLPAALLSGVAALSWAQPEVRFSMYPVPGVRFGVSGITTGPDRTLWFTADNSIWRLTLTGVMTEFRLPDDGVFYPMGRGAASITSGPDGALWFTEVTANKIGRITTAHPARSPRGPTAPSGLRN
jgi:hypothetical protein